jgi:hypothetical protein
MEPRVVREHGFGFDAFATLDKIKAATVEKSES